MSLSCCRRARMLASEIRYTWQKFCLALNTNWSADLRRPLLRLAAPVHVLAAVLAAHRWRGRGGLRRRHPSRHRRRRRRALNARTFVRMLFLSNAQLGSLRMVLTHNVGPATSKIWQKSITKCNKNLTCQTFNTFFPVASERRAMDWKFVVVVVSSSACPFAMIISYAMIWSYH